MHLLSVGFCFSLTTSLSLSLTHETTNTHACTECKRDIQTQVESEMQEMNIDPQVAVHMTSIYDHSIFEAMSKVIQKLIPQLQYLENLLDMLTSVCSFSFLGACLLVAF